MVVLVVMTTENKRKRKKGGGGVGGEERRRERGVGWEERGWGQKRENEAELFQHLTLSRD